MRRLQTVPTGKKVLATTLALLALTAGVFTSGCNFFANEQSSGTVLPPGTLPDGSSIVGTWSGSFASLTSTGNPSDIYVESLTFDPLGNAQMKFQDPHRGGITCTAYGSYRVVGTGVQINVDAVDLAICAFGDVIYYSDVRVRAASLQVTDSLHHTYVYFAQRAGSETALQGLWGFQGAGGLDYILFDAFGYALLQVSEGNQSFLLTGYYGIVAGQLQIRLFGDDDPTHVDPSDTLVFIQYLTDGQSLVLTGEAVGGQSSTYVGTRL